MSAIEVYQPLAQVGAFLVGWCVAMLSGIFFRGLL